MSEPRLASQSVWPLPRSLATTGGISVDVFSSSYLDVSVQTVPLLYLFDSVQDNILFGYCVPTFGNLRVNAYLQLTAAYRSLSRPSSAPDAKASSLRPLSLELLVQTRELCKSFRIFRNRIFTLFLGFPQLRFFLCCLACACYNLLFSFQGAVELQKLTASFDPEQHSQLRRAGGPKWTRTTDLTIISRTL